jgi:WD40 repeat protein
LSGVSARIADRFRPLTFADYTQCRSEYRRFPELSTSNRFSISRRTPFAEAVVIRAKFGPDSSRIDTASQDNAVTIRDVVCGEEVLTIWGRTNSVNVLEIGLGGDRIVTGSWDHSVKIWNAAPVARKETLFRAEAAEAAPQ